MNIKENNKIYTANSKNIIFHFQQNLTFYLFLKEHKKLSFEEAFFVFFFSDFFLKNLFLEKPQTKVLFDKFSYDDTNIFSKEVLFSSYLLDEDWKKQINSGLELVEKIDYIKQILTKVKLYEIYDFTGLLAQSYLSFSNVDEAILFFKDEHILEDKKNENIINETFNKLMDEIAISFSCFYSQQKTMFKDEIKEIQELFIHMQQIINSF